MGRKGRGASMESSVVAQPSEGESSIRIITAGLAWLPEQRKLRESLGGSHPMRAIGSAENMDDVVICILCPANETCKTLA